MLVQLFVGILCGLVAMIAGWNLGYSAWLSLPIYSLGGALGFVCFSLPMTVARLRAPRSKRPAPVNPPRFA